LFDITKFSLSDFSDDEQKECAKFTALFGGQGESYRKTGRQEEPVRDLESEARKVFEDAYTQGEKAGREMGMKKTEPLFRRLTRYISELDSFREQLVLRAENLSVELGLLFAEAIVRRECEERRDTVVTMAKRALELCKEKNNIIIRIRREDAERITTEGMSHLNLVPDDTLKEPGFIIETDFGDLDGSLSTQIEELRKEFLNA
jgi:flagellar assembly protein FliH